MSEEQMEVPKGYLQDARGNLVRRENIKAIDLKRDVVVRKLWKAASEVSEEVARLRARTLEEIDLLVEETAAKHNVRLGGKKGNVSLTSYDGSVRVLRARADVITFTEQLEVARSLVHECMTDYSRGASRNLKALVESAFAMNEKGQVSVANMQRLRQVKIEDEKWQKAMHIIGESMRVASTREYVRFYRRNAEGEYELVNMNFSG